MSIRLVRKPDGRWLVDIRTKDERRRRLRERLVTPDFVRTEGAAQKWAETRQRELAREGPRSKAADDMPTVEEFGKRFVEEYARANRHKASGIASKERHLKLHICKVMGDLYLDEIDATHVQKLKTHLRGKKPKTVNNVLATLGKMLKVAAEWSVIERAPAVKLLRKPPRPTMAFYDFDQYRALLEGAKKCGAHHRAIVAMLGETGMRRSEIIALEWGDIEGRWVHIQRAEPIPGEVDTPKGNESRRVPISAALAEALSGAPKRGARVFYRQGRGKAPLSVEYLRRIVRGAEAAGGMPVTGRIHILRHTFASHFVMAGGDIYTLQHLLGHKDIATTMVYAHLSPRHMAGSLAPLEKARGANSGQ